MNDKVVKSYHITSNAVEAFAHLSTDYNPVHLDEAFAATSIFKKRIAHGMLCSSFFSALIANELPGPGSIYLSQNLKFLSPVFIGDMLRVEVAVIRIRDDKPIFTLSTKAYVGDTLVIDGEAVVLKGT